MPESDIKKVALDVLNSKLYLRSVHAKCHKTIDKDLSKKEAHWRSSVKKSVDKNLFKKIITIRNVIKSFIKNHRKLT